LWKSIILWWGSISKKYILLFGSISSAANVMSTYKTLSLFNNLPDQNKHLPCFTDNQFHPPPLISS
jgi:hypothetical protein